MTVMEAGSVELGAPPGPRGAVDLNWAAIHALVQEIPKSFRDPSFSHSGTQVSRVVTASDPARELERVRTWQTAVEGIVDELVGAHHGSLSRSIKNYAEIVQLFEANRANVDTLRAVLKESRRRLLVRPSGWRDADDDGAVNISDAATNAVPNGWRRTLVLRELASKLTALENLASVPEAARECVESGDCERAVEKIASARAALRNPEYLAIRPALADLRRECAAVTDFIRGKVTEDIGAVIFLCDAACRREASSATRAPASRKTPFFPLASAPGDPKKSEASPAEREVSRLVKCVAGLGDEALRGALEVLWESVPSEIWILIQEQLLYCYAARDDVERVAAAAATRNDSDIDSDIDFAESAESAESTESAENVTSNAMQPFHDATVFLSPSEKTLDVIVRHICALARAALRNLEALDATAGAFPAATRGRSAAALRARETLRVAVPLAFRSAVRESYRPYRSRASASSGPFASPMREVPAGGSCETPVSRRRSGPVPVSRGDASVLAKKGSEKKRPDGGLRAFAFADGRDGVPEESGVAEGSGEDDFAFFVTDAARKIRAHLGTSSAERIFKLEVVKDLFREIERDDTSEAEEVHGISMS